MAEEWKYQVALSFAGEQREYVERVSKELTRLGVSHFYDNDNRSALWGKSLTQYLDDIYFQKSRFVVAFISNQYHEKIWTRWEMLSAQDRALRQTDEYLLPVYFDEVRLPGLVGSLGHINAHTTSPEELAELIYEKVTGEKLNVNRPVIEPTCYQAPNRPCVNFYEEEYSLLQGIYRDLRASTAAVVLGEKGLGKRTVIQLFLDGKTGVIHVMPNREPHYQLEPLVDAIENGGALFASSDDLIFPERLKKQLLALSKEKQTIFYFEGMDQYEEGLVSFLLDLSREILLRHHEYKALLIFEYDSDSNGSLRLARLLSALPPMSLDFIPFKRVSVGKLQVYLEKMYGTIEIEQSDLTYILNSSYGNVMYLNMIMSYLRIRGILIKKGHSFACGHIAEGTLTDILGEYIKQRYDRLNPDLKDVLSKSAIIGNTFSSDLLTRPFGILHAQELLDKIESVSLLIRREDEAIYTFESPESFRIISASIGENERKQWHRILANYFIRRLERLKNSHPPFCPEQEIVCLHSATRHYKFSSDYEMAITYSYQLACRYLEISDYDNTKKAISETRSMSDLVNLTDIPIENLEFHLAILEAHCLADMGNYSDALLIYQSCLKQLSVCSDKMHIASIKLDTALCHYMNGATTTALDLAEMVKEELEQDAPESLLYCRALSYLASFNDCTGKQREKQNYFIQALTICRDKAYENDYYQLLKKASMVYDESIAINMYPAAKQYFEAQHKIKCMAELLHNVATDYLYLADQEQILAPLQKSITLFSEFGSAMIHYPLNTQGIYTAVFDQKYGEAITHFYQALSYQPECYSQVVLKANLASCYLVLGQTDQAKDLLMDVEQQSELPINSDVYDYQIYRSLMWALYHYKVGSYELCMSSIEKCLSLPELEPRFQYMAHFLSFLAGEKLGITQPPMTKTPPKPVLSIYREQEVLFFSLRFYE